MSPEPIYDAIVIGAGHNGLVTAAYLAKAGRRVLVLERREKVGGILETVEVAPGIRAPGISHTVGRLRRSVIEDLGLERHGLLLTDPPVRVFAPQPDGSALTLWADPARTADELRARSPHDADAYPRFDARVRALASFLAYLFAATPPDVKSPSFGDAMSGVRIGTAFRRLGRKAAREATRALPMAIADYVAESFETDAVRGAIASRAVQYTAMGPWSAGTTAVFLGDSAGNDGGGAGQSTIARGGPRAVADALSSAAVSLGAEIRTGTEVVEVLTKEHRAIGVALASGEELHARVVVSAADPKRTVTTLLDPVVAGPDLMWRAGNIRTPGIVSKVNLALSGLPAFVGAEGDERLSGRIVIAPGIDYLEKAFDASKYGRMSDEPYLEAAIPTLLDHDAGRPGTGVRVVGRASAACRARPRPVLRLAAAARPRAVPVRHRRPVPVRVRRPPRRRRDWRAGRERGARDPQRPQEAQLTWVAQSPTGQPWISRVWRAVTPRDSDHWEGTQSRRSGFR